MAIAKEQLRQLIKENDLKSVGDVYALLKDSFKELLQEFLITEKNALYSVTGKITIQFWIS